MTKSKQVQADVKYLHNPKAIHFKIISKKNNTAKTILTIFRMNINSSLSCKLMSSKHRLKLEAKINNKMVHSKNGLSTTLWTNWRLQVHDLPKQVPPRKEQHENLKKYDNQIRKHYYEKTAYMRSQNIGQQGSGTFFGASLSVPAPASPLPTQPSSKVRLLLGPEKTWKLGQTQTLAGKIQSYLVTLLDSSKEKVRDKMVIQGD